MSRADWIYILGILIIALGSIIGTFIMYYAGQLKLEEQKLLTTETGSLDTPKIDPSKPITIQLGGFIFTPSLNDLENGFDPRKVANLGFDYPFTISVKDNQLFVSAEIKNEKNETVAIIVDNQWTVNNDPIIARDRNYNAYAFEVIDSKLIPRLQVIIEPNNMIYVGGYFSTPVGNILMMPGTTITQPTSEMLKQYLIPIFEYPSNVNFGKMNPDVKLVEK